MDFNEFLTTDVNNDDTTKTTAKEPSSCGDVSGTWTVEGLTDGVISLSKPYFTNETLKKNISNL